MRKMWIAAATVAVAALAPGLSQASHADANCGHANNNDVHQDGGTGGQLVVYADTNGRDGGMSRSADGAVGVCSNLGGAGGTLESGYSTRFGKGAPVGAYAIADGARGNPSPGDGYAGVSNYERSSGSACPNDPHYNSPCSSNSGGEVGASGVGYAPVPLIVCGDTSGPWDNTERDGCEAN